MFDTSVVSSTKMEKHFDSFILSTILFKMILLQASIIWFWIPGLVYLFRFPGPSSIDLR